MKKNQKQLKMPNTNTPARDFASEKINNAAEGIKKTIWWMKLIKIVLLLLAVAGFCFLLIWGLPRIGTAIGETLAEGWKKLPVWN